MRQQKFMQELETGLRGRIADEEAQDILAEYRSFFVSGAAENKSEEDICALLGSPAALVQSLTGAGNGEPKAVPKLGIVPAPLGKRVAAVLIDRMILLLIYGAVTALVGFFSFLTLPDPQNGNVAVGINIAPVFLLGFVLPIGLPFSPLTVLPVTIIVSMLVSALLRLLDIGAGAIIGMVPLSWLLLFLLLSLYKPVTECLMHGQTVGKRLMGLRVTAADGSPASAGAIWRRELLGDILLGTVTCGITAIVSGFLAAGKSRRSLPDQIGDTIVIETAEKSNKEVVGWTHN